MAETEHVCGVSYAMLEFAGQAQWDRSCMKTLKYWSDFRGLRGMSRNEFIAQVEQGMKNITKVSGADVVFTTERGEGKVLMTGEAMRGSTLAYAYFPSGCRQIQQRFNTNVNWTPELFIDTLVHEWGHSLGLDHTNDRRDIMYPSIIPGRDLNGEYGPYSIPELIKRYGEEDDVPDDDNGDDTPPPPPPPPPPGPNIPWDTLLEIFIQLIKGCLPSANRAFIRGELQRMPWLARLKIQRALIKQFGRRYFRENKRELLQIVYAHAAVLPDETIDACIMEAISRKERGEEEEDE